MTLDLCLFSLSSVYLPVSLSSSGALCPFCLVPPQLRPTPLCVRVYQFPRSVDREAKLAGTEGGRDRHREKRGSKAHHPSSINRSLLHNPPACVRTYVHTYMVGCSAWVPSISPSQYHNLRSSLFHQPSPSSLPPSLNSTPTSHPPHILRYIVICRSSITHPYLAPALESIVSSFRPRPQLPHSKELFV
ncbi:hypothetical protein F4778DRAFT_737009 [Xylariomycetidae sp. FL2044]|nr:hypothetical protein F4778DRAFT_737009 [Xylariomycetidae sp. FL2044]